MVIILLFIVCSLFAWAIESSESELTRKRLTFICLLILTLVSGTRLVGGDDFFVYSRHYDNVPTFPDVLNPSLQGDLFEIGYEYITSFFKTLGVSFYGFCLIHAMIFYFCLWKGLKRYTSHFGIVILIFLYKLFYYNTMISMRQSLTVAFFLNMVPLIEQKKYVKYYVASILVSTIHNGAYLLFALYPLVYFALTSKRIVWLNVIFFPTIFLGLAGINVFGLLEQFMVENAANEQMATKAMGYFGNENASGIGIFHTFEYFLLMVLVLINLKRFNLRDSRVHVVMWMFLCLLPLFTLFRGSEILTREKDYFTIYYAVVIGYLIDRLPRYRTAIYLCTLLICAFGYYRYAILFDKGGLLLYKSWLFEQGYSFFLK